VNTRARDSRRRRANGGPPPAVEGNARRVFIVRISAADDG